MFGIGPTELVIIVIVALAAFGTPVLAFLLGFTMGRRSSALPAEGASVSAAHEDETEVPE